MPRALTTITVGELKDILESYDDDTPVIFTACYGDYGRTPQALELVGHDEEVNIVETPYSRSGYAIARHDDDEDRRVGEGDEPETYLLIC